MAQESIRRSVPGEMNRRDFLRAAAGVAGATTLGGIPGILAAAQAPAAPKGTKLHLLRWVDFVPAGDEELRRQAPEAGKALGAEITLETINANDLQARITTAIESKSGPDIIMMLHNWTHLYAKGAADMSDVAGPIGKAQGGYYGQSEAASKVGGRWLSVPHGIVGLQTAYRKSWFAEVGVTQFPTTWEAYGEAGKKLKAKGYPIGQTLGHTFGDAPAWSYPLLWSFGGKEVEKDGKQVAINSKETVESVKFMTAFWKDACDEGGLAWDDTSNNRAFLSGTISATLNGASIYIEALRKPDQYKTDKGAPMHTDILHAPLPKGAAGQFAYHVPFAHMVMNYSKNQKLAKDFLRWLMAKEQFEKWFLAEKGFSVGSTKIWEKHKMWEADPVMLPYKDAARFGRMFGYAGPPTAKATEAYSKYIITDMYAKAVQGMAPEEAVKWAEGELRKIYGS